MRRDVSTLAENDPIIEAYKSAVTQMKELPSSDGRNWTRQAQIHNDFCPHGNWLFLPWHRAYLFYFERICRKLSGMTDFALPYWNWSTNPQIPAVFFGDTSNPLLDTTRVATASSTASATNVGPDVLNGILNEPNFLVFGSGSILLTDNQRAAAGYGPLEGTPHNYIHGFVRGNMGGFMSPLDPLFWLHHNMVERCWVEWNFIRGFENTDDSNWLNREFSEFFDENGNPVTTSTLTGLLYPILAYRYDFPPPPAVASRRSVSARVSAFGATPNERWRKLGSEKKEDVEAGRIAATTGARVKIEVLNSFAAETAATAQLGKTFSVPLAIEPSVLPKGDADPTLRTFLVFDDVDADHTGEFSVRVFINKPDATVETPTNDPSYVGTFSFFHHAHHGVAAQKGPKYQLEVPRNLEKAISETGRALVNFVLDPFPGREIKSPTWKNARVALHVTKDSIE